MRPPLYDANIGLQKSRIRTHNTQRWGLAPAVWAQMMYGRFEQSLPTDCERQRGRVREWKRNTSFSPISLGPNSYTTPTHGNRCSACERPFSFPCLRVSSQARDSQQLKAIWAHSGGVRTGAATHWACRRRGKTKKKVTCLSDSPYSFGPFTASIRKNGDVIRYARLKYLQPDAMGCISESDMLIHIRWNQLPFSVGFEFPGGEALRLGT